MRTSDSRKRAESDDLDDLSQDALVARVREHEAVDGERFGLLLQANSDRDSALAARDAVAAELAALREALGRLVDRWSESEHWPTVDHAVALAVLLDETRGERPSPDGQHGRPVVLNPEAIGDPDQTPVVQLSRGESDE